MLICLTVWAAFLPATFSHNSWVYSWDSAAYIETANSIHAGRGLMQRVIHGLEPRIWEPISWWPPGYPILIASAQMVGLSAASAGVVVAIAAAAISVILVSYVCLQLFDWLLALLVTLAIVCMPIFLQISTQCMSDSSYFAFAAASVACLVNWSVKSRPSVYWIFGAGLFAGAAWGVRYVGSALFAATGIFLLAHFVWSRIREVVKLGSVWFIGISVCSLPLVIRNLSTFGRINPYNMPPSELSLWANVRRAFLVVVEDLTTSPIAADWIVDKRMFPVYTVVFFVALTLWLRRISASQVLELLKRHKIQLFFIAYVIIYTAVVIAARTQFRWGEEIDPRHMVAIYWIIWICVLLWTLAFLRFQGVGNIASRNMLIFGFLIVVGLQVRDELERVTRPTIRPEAVEARLGSDAVNYLAREVSKNQIVLSTRAELLRVHADINARKLPPISQYDFLQAISRDDINRLGQSGFLWGIVVEDIKGAGRGNYDVLIKQIIEKPERFPELERVRVASPAIIFRYIRRAPVSLG